MPTPNYIADLLGLEDVIIKKIETNDTENHVFFTLKRRPHTCPNCASITEQVHDYRTSILKDLPFMGKKTLFHYSKRRYHCPACGKHFYETFSAVPKHCRITTRAGFYAVDLLRNRLSVKDSASMIGISVSSVFRRMKDIRFPKPKNLPLVLSIDEFKGNAGNQKFQAILTDAKNKKLVDILPDRSQRTLSEYFQGIQNRKDVRYFVMDMNQVYRDLARTYLPNATIVIDRFHVVRYVTWALENVRKRIQKDMHKEKRRYFKRSRRLLLSSREKLKEEQMEALEVMLQQSSDLATAYHLKEVFYEFMRSQNRADATKQLRRFINLAQNSQLNEFKACLTMLGNWSKYILNAIDCPYSNGFTEGTNNAIKVIKRNAFGYRNFDNFRNRIFLALT